MGVNKPWAEKTGLRDRHILDDRMDSAIANFDRAGKDPFMENVHDLSVVVGVV
jgi:hypothetical protein